MQRPSFDGRGRGESLFDVTAGISMVELEFVVVEFIFFLVEGYTPPIKMDRFENKGVAGRAFSKWLNGKGMDAPKFILGLIVWPALRVLQFGWVAVEGACGRLLSLAVRRLQARPACDAARRRHACQ